MKAPETLSAQTTPEREQLGAHGLPRKHFKTEGERKFDWQTYTGLGYFANVAISLAAVYWAERTHLGQRFIKGLGEGFAAIGLKRKDAEFLGRKSFFLAGGFAVMPFMKQLENGKVERVKEYNRAIYGAQADTDPTILQSERELEQAPRQTWASLVSGRLLALVPFYATVGLLWNRESVLSRVSHPDWSKVKNLKGEINAIEAGKGWYFDRPITNFSRDIGKLISSRGTYFDAVKEEAGGLAVLYHKTLSLVGKALRWVPENKQAVSEIEAAHAISPGSMLSERKGTHDPLRAVWPYYIISEAITSAMVAWGLFAITRTTAKVFDKNPHEASAPASEQHPETNAQQLLPQPAGHRERLEAARAEPAQHVMGAR